MNTLFSDGYWAGGVLTRVATDLVLDGFVIFLLVRWMQNGCPRFWERK